MSNKVVLSAGHSFYDAGAYNAAEDLKESFLTIELVNLCVPLLRSQGVTVSTIPDDLSLVETIDKINSSYASYDLAIELHINAGGGTGVEGWYYQNSETSKKLTLDILNGMVSETGMKSRGAKDETTNRWGRLGFVHDTVPLATLIECGFIDNQDDLKLLVTEAGRYKISKGIARGICQYLGITWDEEKLPDSADKACQNALKQAIKDAETLEGKYLEWKLKARTREKELKDFKANEYQKAVDLANTMEKKANDLRFEILETKKNVIEPLSSELNDLKTNTIPKIEKDRDSASQALTEANQKVSRLLNQEYTIPEALHFLIRAINKGGGR